ncbi:hypothetical protein GKQ38_00965 [Candidatus Nanohaloarchaea archaeon]|nr:hypothetical protein GKQ38_00965 [Candidatus Nanohaloarchaea archaeon]
MPRPVTEEDEVKDEERFWSDDMKSVMDGEPVLENSRGLTKKEVSKLNERKDGFEGRLLEAGSDYLSQFDVDPAVDEADLVIVDDREDVDYIDEDLDLTQGAAYIHGEDEVLVFTRTRDGTYSEFDPVGSVAHELKHRDQELRYEGTFSDNLPVTEASTQLLNMYREGILEEDRKVDRRVDSLRDSNYSDPEALAEETELAAESYNNLLENDVGPEEAMAFMLNEYEERRIDE